MEGRRWGYYLLKTKLQPGAKPQDCLHVISADAPAYAASRLEKDKFFDAMQTALDELPTNEPYVILGDFNAIVGSSLVDELWDGIENPMALASLLMLERSCCVFLIKLNEATVCYTWFRKNDIYKQTWQHPPAKKMALHRLRSHYNFKMLGKKLYQTTS